MTTPSPIKPPMAADNAWWWQQAAEQKLVIQRCRQCRELRHPPHPMCSHCRCMDWDFIVASGTGSLHTYTVIHHPQFPGYDYPIIVILVDLEEGVRMVSRLVDCDREAVDIGMPLEACFETDAEGFTLPVFRPAAVVQS